MTALHLWLRLLLMQLVETLKGKQVKHTRTARQQQKYTQECSMHGAPLMEAYCLLLSAYRYGCSRQSSSGHGELL